MTATSSVAGLADVFRRLGNLDGRAGQASGVDEQPAGDEGDDEDQTEEIPHLSMITDGGPKSEAEGPSSLRRQLMRHGLPGAPHDEPVFARFAPSACNGRLLPGKERA